MLFNSLEFALFLPIVFLIYWAIGYAHINDRLKLRLQNAFVVIASYVFYGWWDWRFLLLIAFTSFCSWGSGLLIGRGLTRHPHKGRRLFTPKFWMIANIILNLGILAIFKYYDFFVREFGQLFGVSTESLLLRIILPVGISFYTFQALSYSIDVYRKKIEPTRDIVAFFAYVAFFPQLVAGPIERATNLLPQFQTNRKFSYDQAVDGMRQILWGLFKKIVVADNCATYVDQVWSTYDTQTGSTLLLAAILFTFQIYGDFSGYSDIAVGTAKLFGIKLMRNFNNPYFSRDIAEFWRRWHISLTTWFRDYVAQHICHFLAFGLLAWSQLDFHRLGRISRFIIPSAHSLWRKSQIHQPSCHLYRLRRDTPSPSSPHLARVPPNPPHLPPRRLWLDHLPCASHANITSLFRRNAPIRYPPRKLPFLPSR